uniref:Uncharacterized protein n=1 Tax=Rhizophora mucronata TaxID=61149 RepID=A0A2P2P864_RHIMU
MIDCLNFLIPQVLKDNMIARLYPFPSEISGRLVVDEVRNLCIQQSHPCLDHL